MKQMLSDIRFPSGLSFGIAFLWQIIPAILLMCNMWDSPSTLTLILRAIVFLIVPLVSGLVHRSWQIGVAAFLLPIFAIIAMFAVYVLIMPRGKW